MRSHSEPIEAIIGRLYAAPVDRVAVTDPAASGGSARSTTTATRACASFLVSRNTIASAVVPTETRSTSFGVSTPT